LALLHISPLGYLTARRAKKRKPEKIIYSTNKTKDKFPSPTNWRYGTPCM